VTFAFSFKGWLHLKHNSPPTSTLNLRSHFLFPASSKLGRLESPAITDVSRAQIAAILSYVHPAESFVLRSDSHRILDSKKMVSSKETGRKFLVTFSLAFSRLFNSIAPWSFPPFFFLFFGWSVLLLGYYTAPRVPARLGFFYVPLQDT
jgi:hypothetical protein